MAYSIHSTEVGGTLASLRLLHHLASSDDPRVRAMLDATVLLVLPSHNPDGTDLVAEWYRRQLGTPFEGTSPPALYHPYVGHDNNRDWYMFTQAETRLTVRHLYHRWHPQVVHDVHQMGTRGARIFVPPYADPWEPNVDGALVAAAGALGSHVASRLTTAGRTGVVTGAIFDAWTPGRAYPHTHGGVRLLSETASARLATPIEVKPEELERRRFRLRPAHRLRQLPRAVAGGHVAARRHRRDAAPGLARHPRARGGATGSTGCGRRSRRTAGRARGPSPSPSWCPPGSATPRPSPGSSRCCAWARWRCTGPPRPSRRRGRVYGPGALVVRMQQPASGFAKTLLERQRYPDLREHEGGPPKRPYDVTAHTLPLLLGVEVDAVASPFGADLEPVGDEGGPAGTVEGRGPRLALGHASGELVALARLLEQGVPVRWALEAFTDAGRSFPAGTLLVPASARRFVAPLASELGFVARAVRAEPRALRLRRPRVGLYRSWVPSMDEGWTRFVFEKEMAVAYEELRDREVRAGDLRRRFDAVVLPDQSPAALLNGHAKGSMPEEYVGGLGADGVAALRDFVEKGGTLVALDSAAVFAIDAAAAAREERPRRRRPGRLLLPRLDPRGEGRPRPPAGPRPPGDDARLVRGVARLRGGDGRHRPALRGRGPAPLRLAPRRRAAEGQGPRSWRCRSERDGSCSSASGRSTARRAA